MIIILTMKKERWQIWTHRELVDQAPAEFLREEACDATLPHDLGQLSSITECVRQPELKSRERVNASCTFSTYTGLPLDKYLISINFTSKALDDLIEKGTNKYGQTYFYNPNLIRLLLMPVNRKKINLAIPRNYIQYLNCNIKLL